MKDTQKLFFSYILNIILGTVNLSRSKAPEFEWAFLGAVVSNLGELPAVADRHHGSAEIVFKAVTTIPRRN